MKTIELLRHAKSCWNSPGLADHLRPLKGRGVRDCELMAPVLHDLGCQFINCHSSSAKRATQTIERLIEVSPGIRPQPDWLIDEQLYTFDSDQLMIWLTSQSNEQSSVMLVGHNPAFTAFTQKLCQLDYQQLDNIPTCGYVQMTCQVDHWIELSHAQGQLKCTAFPRHYR